MTVTVIGVYGDGRRVSILVKDWDKSVAAAKAKGMTLVADKDTSPEDGNTFEQSSKAEQKAATQAQKERAKRNAEAKAKADAGEEEDDG